MIGTSVQNKDTFRIEAEAEEMVTTFKFTVRGGPTIDFSGKVQAKVIKMVVISVSILATLFTGLIGFIGYIIAVR